MASEQKVLDMEMIARRDFYNGEWLEQSLEDHLLQAGERAYEIGSSIGIGSICLIVALFHDVGKATSDFQKYIRSGNNEQVIHSTQGAIWLFGYIGQKNFNGDVATFLTDALVYSNLAHHGLMDNVLLNDKKYFSNIRRRLETYYNNSPDGMAQTNSFISAFIPSIEMRFGSTLDSIFDEALEEASEIYGKIVYLVGLNDGHEESEVEEAFYTGCFIRLVLSILKEADMYNSQYAFATNKGKVYSPEEVYSIWEEGQQVVEAQAEFFERQAKDGSLNYIRCSLSAQARGKALSTGAGIYRLDLPTGSGKTQTVLRFALNHSVTNHSLRVIYLAPYLSVLEQNAQVIKNVLGQEEYILEHHSNIIDPRDDDDETKDDAHESEVRNYLVESWETPYILTTLVQFTNTLFSGRASSIRRFSKLIRSVVIMDEIQSLPLKAIYPFNLMSNFLSYIMGATILHCTATPPFFDHQEVNHPIIYGSVKSEEHVTSSIAEVEQEGQTYFERVTYKSLLGSDASEKMRVSEVANHVMEQLHVRNSALIVCNTKQTAYDLYISLKDTSDCQLFYLTTYLCASHREDVINEMKKVLLQNRNATNPKDVSKVICVSTQLIEAGVDLDFDCVYRAAAGVDRIVQTAGRCNREGKLSMGDCFIFQFAEENLNHLQDIRSTQDALRASLRQVKERDSIDIDNLLETYFNRYYVRNADQMNYYIPKVGTSILEMLSDNRQQVEELKSVYYIDEKNSAWCTNLRQQFRTAGQNFKLIEENDTFTLLVQYQNEELIEGLYQAEETYNLQAAKALLRKLNRYTVQVSKYWLEKNSNLVIKLFSDSILLLDISAYDEALGLRIPDQLDLLLL